MKSIIFSLLVLFSITVVASDYSTWYRPVETCTVIALPKLFHKPAFKVDVKLGDLVVISEYKNEPTYLRADLGTTVIETTDDDEVQPKPTLAGKAFSLVPNNPETIFVLEIANGKGLLTFMNTAYRDSFQTLATLVCK
ncbi:MAG: hypothetical protein AB7O96_12120 [Pseudobdellovibrionaceae bacterium]